MLNETESATLKHGLSPPIIIETRVKWRIYLQLLPRIQLEGSVVHSQNGRYRCGITITNHFPHAASYEEQINYQRLGRLSVGMAPTCNIYYAILKQKSYNFTTNTLKAYLSAQASSFIYAVCSRSI